MKVEVGQRYIWEEPKRGLIPEGLIFKGMVIKFIGDNIVISWKDSIGEDIRPIQYSKDQFSELLQEDEPRLKIDKEYYRHKSLTELGI